MARDAGARAGGATRQGGELPRLRLLGVARRTRLSRARGDLRRAGRGGTVARASGRSRCVPDGPPRLLGSVAGRGRSRRGAHRLVAGAAAASGRRRAARRHDPARDRASEPGRRADRRRRLDGRRHLRRRDPRRGTTGRARPVRRRAGAQGVRARGRAGRTDLVLRRRRGTESCSSRRSRSSTDFAPDLRERAAGLRLPGDS